MQGRARLLLLLIAGALPLGAQAQSLQGLWLSGEWGGVRSVVEVAPCAEGLCGTIVDVRGGPAQEGVIGHRIFWGFTMQSDGSFSAGKLKPPGGVPQLNARIIGLTDAALNLRACLLLICRNEEMTRL